jgi:hypothetical protein
MQFFLEMKDSLFNAVISMIKNDRENQIVDRTKIKGILQIFEEVDMQNAELNKVENNFFWKGDSEMKVIKEFFWHYLIPCVMHLLRLSPSLNEKRLLKYLQ